MVNTLFKKYIINAPNLYHLPSTLSAHQVHLYPSFNTPPQPPKEEKKKQYILVWALEYCLLLLLIYIHGYIAKNMDWK